MKNKFAFTLAEVLITLVIIGIIAAMTIPVVISKARHKAFESQFKKSVSVIGQIINRSKLELSVNNLGKFCSEYDNQSGGYYNTSVCLNAIKKQLNGKKIINRVSEDFFNYNGKTKFSQFDSSAYSIFYPYQMSDGSFLGFNITNACLFFSVDLNGDAKPNKLGHDIFLYSVSKSNDSIVGYKGMTPNNNISDEMAAQEEVNYNQLIKGAPCNLTSTRETNGIGCAYFALINKCPYDDSKTYFDCLP